MVQWNIDEGKKVTGGKITKYRKKKKFQRGSLPLLTRMGEEKKLKEEGRGRTKKIKLFQAEFANVTNPKTNKTKKVNILDVIKNPANPQYVRRRIITKGTIIKTELGDAKVLSRPSQEGVVNAVIVQEE
jgi:small subunit ribosomal protein S8e